MGRTGLEHSAKTPENTANSNLGAAECGAVGNKSTIIDQDLQRIIESWSHLPDEIQATILRIIEATT